jgi:transposase
VKIEKIDISKSIENLKHLLREEKNISPVMKAAIEMILVIVSLLAGRVSLNSNNSSKPPSSDPNRKKLEKKTSDKKQGGQPGRVGKNLVQTDAPDEIVEIAVDRAILSDAEYQEAGHEVRQVFDIRISRYVIEYRAQKLRGLDGKIYTAKFPEGVVSQVQYGNGIKAHSVYMSQFQLIPYDRINDHFAEQIKVPVSVGSIFNFNKEAYERLEDFERLVKQKLSSSALAHADETGINVGGKRIWLHNVSNDLWTHLYPHNNRGNKATDEIGILPEFKGILCHDHWKAYYAYQNCKHSLCNAHHLRELQAAIDIDKCEWAKQMQDLLKEMNIKVDEAGGALDKIRSDEYRIKYRAILTVGDQETPPSEPQKNKSGSDKKRAKRSKNRNLLERLRSFEDDVLRFMEDKIVPFTNNQGENDLRMTKVQQKISGCFRSIEGAKIFCRIRSYILTCQKQDVSITDAFKLLFEGKLPQFCDGGE